MWGHYWFGGGVDSREGRDEIKDGYKGSLVVSLKFDFSDSLIGIEVCIYTFKELIMFSIDMYL